MTFPWKTYFTCNTVLSVIIFLLCCETSAWNPDMPGGMKLIINGDIYSFKTDLCSGGVFFKRPVHIALTCMHGYYLERQNGCTMEGSRIIGGQNYVCQRVNKYKSQLVQAFIPITNPEKPLDHTITFFDDPSTLRNLRRYTYVQGLEGGYASESSQPVGVIVTNMQETPKVSIGSLCYQGKAQHSSSSIVARLDNLNQASSKRIFRSGCEANTIAFPGEKYVVYNFSEGYSSSDVFDNEIKAQLSSASHLSDQQSEFIKHEIWGGLAYCLHAKVKVSSHGRIKMKGIQPSIESLQQFCTKSDKETPTAIEPSAQNRPIIRKIRETQYVETSLEFNTLMTCVATCWKNGHDKCHQNPPQLNHMPFCPPYCGGMRPKVHSSYRRSIHQSPQFSRHQRTKRRAISPYFQSEELRFKPKYPSTLTGYPKYRYGRPQSPVVMRMF